MSGSSNPANVIDRITLQTGGGTKHIIEEDALAVVVRSRLNFTGAGVTLSDDAGGDRTTVTITGGTGTTVTGVDNIAARDLLTPAEGDIAFVRDAIADADVTLGWAVYLYDTGAWQITSSEENVLFDTELADGAETTEVGGVDSGITMLSLRGTPLAQIVKDIIFKAVSPIYDLPTLTTALSGIAATTIEVGELVSPTATGTYTQNQAGATLLERTQRDLDGGGWSTIDTGDLVYLDSNISLNSPGTISYRHEVDYDDAPELNNNLGVGDPTGIFTADTVTSTQEDITVVYPWFWGVGTSKPTTSAHIIAGTKVVAAIGASLDITFGSASNQYIWFAVANTEPAYTAWEIDALNKGLIGSADDLFPAAITISVTGDAFTFEYEVYISNYTTEVSDEMTIT